MIHELIMLLSASAATPAIPLTASLSESGGTVRVGWANAGSYQTRIYYKTPYTATDWILLTTALAAVVTYDTGHTNAQSYTYGVAHYNGGLESDVRTATALTPPTPTGGFISEY